MLAQYSFPPHHLPPTTPPPTEMYHSPSIFHPPAHHPRKDSDLGYEDSDLHVLSCQHYPPPPPLSTAAASCSQQPMSPYAGPSRPPRLWAATDLATPALVSDESGETPVRGKMDMNMAVKGSVAAQPGIQTPLASYAAQMVVWLWFGKHTGSPSPISPHTSPFSSMETSRGGFSQPSSSSLHPLQVSPSPYFAAFVARLLQITMVSHSVTLISLLYVYRLKLHNQIKAEPGSEQRPFVASLILANKYLDDNTYTNATWAELSGLPLPEINKMEAEFLRGLSYDLGVERSEYQHWRNLLDGFILARQREAPQNLAAPHHRPSWSPQTVLYTPTANTVPTLGNGPAVNYRARSASPPSFSPPFAHHQSYTYAFPSPTGQRKRNAGEAFAMDIPNPTVMYEQMRFPPRKVAFNSVDATNGLSPFIPSSPQGTTGGLARSSSLNRRFARMPGVHDRRGSMGQLYGVATPEPTDLRPAAAVHGWQQEGYGHSQWQGCSALVAPCERAAQPQVVPPEHLLFYTLAAEAHPGQDGAPRKAILRYQHPSNPFVYPVQVPSAPPPVYPVNPYYEDIIMSYTHPTGDVSPYSALPYCVPPPTHMSAYAEPEPAQFANAGPPGYAYGETRGMMTNLGDLPHSASIQPNGFAPTRGLGISGVHGLNRCSMGSDEGFQVVGPSQQQQGAPVWRTRSQWSSPLVGVDWTQWHGR